MGDPPVDLPHVPVCIEELLLLYGRASPRKID